MGEKNNKNMVGLTRREALRAAAFTGTGAAATLLLGKTTTAQQFVPVVTVADPRFSQPVINPTRIPKFVDPLPVPGQNWPIIDLTPATAGSNPTKTITLESATVRILPSNLSPALNTEVWCYRGGVPYAGTYLGPTLLVESNRPVTINYDYSNLPTTSYLLKRGTGTESVIDKHLHGTDRGEPEVRNIAHQHGALGIDQASDGYPEAWVTPDGFTQANPAGQTNPEPPTVPPMPSNGVQTHAYPNSQQAALSWYHDHALGITRLNVYAGGAGGYIVTDDVEKGHIADGYLPPGAEGLGIPLVIQDRMFYADGRLAYPDLNPTAAALIALPCETWMPANDVSTRPEFFGDVIVVNGKAWPVMDVEPKVYRFRILNGCNSRFLDLSLSPSVDFSIIGTEGGFLPSGSVARKNLLVGGAERFDVLVDFRGYRGKTITMINRGAKKPFPRGTPPNPQSDGLVMQFRVANSPVLNNVQPTPPGFRWNPLSPPPAPPQGPLWRGVLLFEGVDHFGRIKPMLGAVDNLRNATPLEWHEPITERPKAGTVEVWEVYNTSADSHPVHIHEAQLRVLNRQPIRFKAPAVACNDKPTFPIALNGAAKAGEAYEQGFKDTAICPPGEVTRIVVDFSTARTGTFVWHCHILEHEDHEMMRPMEITP